MLKLPFKFKVGDRVKLRDEITPNNNVVGVVLVRYKIRPNPRTPVQKEANGYLVNLDESFFNPVFEQESNGQAFAEFALEPEKSA